MFEMNDKIFNKPIIKHSTDDYALRIIEDHINDLWSSLKFYEKHEIKNFENKMNSLMKAYDVLKDHIQRYS